MSGSDANGMYGFAVEKWDARRHEWEWRCGSSGLRNIGDLLQEVATETDGTNIPLCCALPLARSVTAKIKRCERDNQGVKTKLFNDPTVYGENSGRVLEAGWRVRLFQKQGIYDFYRWLDRNTRLDSGIHVRYYDDCDGSESVKMAFDDRYQWDDDVEAGNKSRSEDAGVKEWVGLFERMAYDNCWAFDVDEYEDVFSVSVRDPHAE